MIWNVKIVSVALNIEKEFVGLSWLEMMALLSAYEPDPASETDFQIIIERENKPCLTTI